MKRPLLVRLASVASAAALVLVGAAGPAQAAPGIASSQSVGPQQADIPVHSAAMNRNIPLTILSPKDTSKPAPVLYLLNGAGGGEDSAT